MHPNGHQESVRSSEIAAQIGSRVAGEIDLYEELNAFVEMTPEERFGYLHPPKAETKTVSELPIEALAPVAVESVPEADLVDVDPRGVEETEETIETPGEADDRFDFGPLDDPVLDTDLASAESTQTDELLGVTGDLIDLRFDTEPDGAEADELDIFQGSGAFAGLKLEEDYGDPIADTSHKACPSCEAELGTDDLFCADCGSFLNGLSPSTPPGSICSECNQGISTDEVFCPWCGSVLAAG
jgi:RNA polymerase subunit RPABC4/transcription elongation factor Spt4